MTRRVAVAMWLFATCAPVAAGCASAEDANVGGNRDLAVAVDAGDDLATAGPADLLRIGPDGGVIPPVSCAAGKHVVVNEVKVAGVSGGTTVAGDEFIELYNPCGNTIDLAGSSLVYRSATGVNDVVIINLTKMIAAGGYYLVAGPNFSNGGTPDQSYGGGRLAAAGGGVGLRDGAQLLVDSVGYGTATNAFVESSAAAAPPNGQSIARTPNGADSDHNATDFAVATTPTPRAAN
jgi:hypothetical protein